VSRSPKIQLVVFIVVRTVFNTALRLVYPFLPIFARAFGVEVRTLTSAVALRSAVGVLSPFLGGVADQRGRKVGMLTGLGLFIAAQVLVLAWPIFPVFVLAMMINMLAYFIFNPAMQAYLGDRVPYRQRGRTLALAELGWSLSFIIGMPVVAFLVGRYGWQAPFTVLAGLGLAAWIIMAQMLPGDPVAMHERPGQLRLLRQVFSYKPALAGLLMGMAFSMANELVNLTFGVWLEQRFALKVTALGAAAAVIGFSELGGELLSAGSVDRLGKPRAVAGGLLANCVMALALWYFGSSLVGAFVGLFLFYLTFEYTIVSSVPMMTEIMPQARATVMASFLALLSLGRALGGVLAPVLFDKEIGWAFLPASLSGLEPGMLRIALGVILFNLLGLLALRYLRKVDLG
jgi:predicted MFS family arabinose efflux permease